MCHKILIIIVNRADEVNIGHIILIGGDNG